MSGEPKELPRWAALEGRWLFSGAKAVFEGSEGPGYPIGIAVRDLRLKKGTVRVSASLHDTKEGNARILFGFDPDSGNYFSAGIGGYGRAYALSEFVSGRGWHAVRATGTTANLKPDTSSEMILDILGQRVALSVNGVEVLRSDLPHPLLGDQVGLLAWGPSKVFFERLTATTSRPRAFVIMQFGEPFDDFFEHVIRRVADEQGFEAFRAKDVYKPGMILEDITRDIVESEVVIAEITSGNPNVFYELGYAHAIGKQVILMADRAVADLPFDIRGYRCIFYEDTIKGKPEVEEALRKHLEYIRRPI